MERSRRDVDIRPRLYAATFLCCGTRERFASELVLVFFLQVALSLKKTAPTAPKYFVLSCEAGEVALASSQWKIGQTALIQPP